VVDPSEIIVVVVVVIVVVVVVVVVVAVVVVVVVVISSFIDVVVLSWINISVVWSFVVVIEEDVVESTIDVAVVVSSVETGPLEVVNASVVVVVGEWWAMDVELLIGVFVDEVIFVVLTVAVLVLGLTVDLRILMEVFKIVGCIVPSGWGFIESLTFIVAVIVFVAEVIVESKFVVNGIDVVIFLTGMVALSVVVEDE
jgi:hypothetical protein